MDTATTLIIIGSLLPVLIRFAKRAHYDPVINGAIAVAVYVIVGVASPFVAGQPVTLNNLITNIGIVMAAGTVGYVAFWKNIENPATTVETPLKYSSSGDGPATTPGP